MTKQKAKDIDFMKMAMERNIKERFIKPKLEWEDKHPYLATTISISYFIFRPINLVIAGIIAIIILLI